MKNLDRSDQACAKIDLMQLLFRHGGSLRAASLLKLSELPLDNLCIIVNALLARGWIRARRLRKPCPKLPDRLRLLDRLVITRWGRFRMIRKNDPAQP
jgi:hypothetical protein